MRGTLLFPVPRYLRVPCSLVGPPFGVNDRFLFDIDNLRPDFLSRCLRSVSHANRLFRLRLASQRVEQFIILERISPTRFPPSSHYIPSSPFHRPVPSLSLPLSFRERFDTEAP